LRKRKRNSANANTGEQRKRHRGMPNLAKTSEDPIIDLTVFAKPNNYQRIGRQGNQTHPISRSLFNPQTQMVPVLPSMKLPNDHPQLLEFNMKCQNRNNTQKKAIINIIKKINEYREVMNLPVLPSRSEGQHVNRMVKEAYTLLEGDLRNSIKRLYDENQYLKLQIMQSSSSSLPLLSGRPHPPET